MNQIALAVIAGCGFSIAAMLGLLGVAVSNTVRLGSIAIAAGILLAITFADLMPDALEDAGRTGAAFGFVTGFSLLFLLEILTKAHTHHHAPARDDADELVALEQHAHRHSPVPFLLGLGVHNVADGLAIGATTALSATAASAVTAGVFVHQLPVGISFAAVLTAVECSRGYILKSAVALGLAIPIGALVVEVLPHSDTMLGVLLAVAGGALTYVAAGHLLPEAHSEQQHGVVGPAFLVALFATTAWFTLVSTG